MPLFLSNKFLRIKMFSASPNDIAAPTQGSKYPFTEAKLSIPNWLTVERRNLAIPS